MSTVTVLLLFAINLICEKFEILNLPTNIGFFVCRIFSSYDVRSLFELLAELPSKRTNVVIQRAAQTFSENYLPRAHRIRVC